MSKQVTIGVVIDVYAALQEGRLMKDLYMIDSESLYGSRGEGSGRLVTHIENGYLIDGSQSEAVILNWCLTGVENLPSSLPRYFVLRNSGKKCIDAISTALDGKESTKNISELFSKAMFPNKIIANSVLGRVNDDDNVSKFYVNLVDITGEAVEKGIIYPARYGTPVPVGEGWYWSASVNTSAPGIYAYTMHIDLYRHGGKEEKPIRMCHEAFIEIADTPQRNGFTDAGMGILPL